MAENANMNFELDFLWEISKALINNYTPENVVEGLRNVFEKFFSVSDFTIYIYDEASSGLRNFKKDWYVISDQNFNPEYLEIFKQLSSSVRSRFILNDSFFVLNDDFNCLPEMNFCNEQNRVYLPIVQSAKTIGMVEVVLSEMNNRFLTRDFLKSLSIATAQISAAIINHKLNSELLRNTNFYCAMKDIAKILENQYEFSYIVPMIGEIIDKFISDHFIYIFGKENNTVKLLWPTNYDQKRLSPLLDKILESKSPEVSQDETIALFPLLFDNDFQGAIVADGKSIKLSKTEMNYILQLTRQASITMDKANTYTEIQHHATLDALTGLNNRRALEIRMKQETAVARRKETSLCCMMIDIDFFKSVNDEYGHSVGDFILKEFGHIVKEEIREYDFAARYGGEEFCVLLPSTAVEETKAVAQRLKDRLQEEEFDISSVSEHERKIKITASIGISCFDKDSSSQKLYSDADKALYQAKQEGRNRIIVHKVMN